MNTALHTFRPRDYIGISRGWNVHGATPLKLLQLGVI